MAWFNDNAPTGFSPMIDPGTGASALGPQAPVTTAPSIGVQGPSPGMPQGGGAQSYGNLSDPAAWMQLVQNPQQLTAWVQQYLGPTADPGLVQYYVGKIQGQPGANPTEQAGSANYWMQKIQSDPSVAGGRGATGGAGSTAGGPGGMGGGTGVDGVDYYAPFNQTFSAPTAADVAQTPGFQFARDQGEQGIQRSAAARGTLLTGGTLKDLGAFDTGLANTYYQNAFNNALNTYGTNRDTFYANQTNPFNKLNTVAALGKPSVP